MICAFQFVSWIPPQAISNAILDVAFAKEEPPIVMNLVHPRPTAWRNLMQPIADAMVAHKVTSHPLPFVSFSEWFEKLELSAKDVSEETMKRIVCVSRQLSRTLSHLAFNFSLVSSFSTSCVPWLNQTA